MKLSKRLFLVPILACWPVENLPSKSLDLEKPLLLERMRTQKVLRVATRYALTTYYQTPTGEFRGLEYELIKRFAENLGLTFQIVVIPDLQQILTSVNQHHVDLAAAGLTSNEAQPTSVQFGPFYQTVTQQVVYRYGGSPPPTQLADFNVQHELHVIAGSSQVNSLKYLKNQYPNLTWKEINTGVQSDLLKQVWEGKILYTVVNSNEIIQIQQFYPELQVGFEFPTPQHLAWAFPPLSGDNTLHLEAIRFFKRLQQSGELERLIERYYGHLSHKDFDYVDISLFYQHVEERLPLYQTYFRQIADQYAIDWRLLAAIGYQESHWNPDAVSKTGVRGIMMLTKATAQEMGVKDRRDPLQSIEGGAKYFLMLKERLNKDIPEPDRTWLTLAAYNVGLGHLRDAQKLAQQQGLHTYTWMDVKKSLLLLSQPRWHAKTNYGYARGYEAVDFVKNVRQFYDMLLQLKDDKIHRPERIPRVWSNLTYIYQYATRTPLSEYTRVANLFPPYLLD